MKTLLIASLSALSLFIGYSPVFAQLDASCTDPEFAQTEFCKQQDATQTTTNNAIVGPDGILTEVVEIITLMVGVASVIGVIIGGMLIVFSGGDSQRVGRGRNAVIYSLVGLVIALFARLIVVYVLSNI